MESLWSIDQYFEFILVLMLSTGLAFQVRPFPAFIGNSYDSFYRPMTPFAESISLNVLKLSSILDGFEYSFSYLWQKADLAL